MGKIVFVGGGQCGVNKYASPMNNIHRGTGRRSSADA